MSLKESGKNYLEPSNKVHTHLIAPQLSYFYFSELYEVHFELPLAAIRAHFSDLLLKAELLGKRKKQS